MTDLYIAPCPFCGSTDCVPGVKFSRSKANPGGTYYTECCTCGAIGPSADTKSANSFRTEEDAVLAWNTRGEAHRKAVEAVEKISAAVVESFLKQGGAS